MIWLLDYKKEEKLNDLRDCLTSYQSVIVVNYSQFLNEQIDRLRDEFFARGGNRVIFAKNNLISLAAREI